MGFVHIYYEIVFVDARRFKLEVTSISSINIRLQIKKNNNKIINKIVLIVDSFMGKTCINFMTNQGSLSNIFYALILRG